MRITHGATRIVILTGDKAVKVARTGIMSLLYQAIARITRPAWFREMSIVHGGTAQPSILIIIRHAFRIIARGIRANRQEYRISKKHPELPIAPVHNMYLWGLVLVMARGDPVSARASSKLRRQYGAFGDLQFPKQVCRVKNRVCYVDYGHPTAPEAFGVI